MEPVYFVAEKTLKPLVARGLKWTVEDVHMIPAHGPAILASNHSAYLDPMAGKTGTARIAAATGVPVTPVGMWGSHRVLMKHRKPNWKWGYAQVACLGPPVRVGPDDDVYEATDRIMEAICAQVSRAREIYPQQPEPGEDDWWVRPPESAVLRSCRDEKAQEPTAPAVDDGADIEAEENA